MTPIALVFLVLSLAIVWGGLVASTIYLRRQPEEDDGDPGTPAEPIIRHDL